MKKIVIVLAALIIICASLYLYAQYPFPINGITRKMNEFFSPDGKYRLVSHSLERVEFRMIFYDKLFSEVYDVKTGKRLGTSPVYDMMYNQPIHWPSPCSPYVSPANGIEIPVPMDSSCPRLLYVSPGEGGIIVGPIE